MNVKSITKLIINKTINFYNSEFMMPYYFFQGYFIVDVIGVHDGIGVRMEPTNLLIYLTSFLVGLFYSFLQVLYYFYKKWNYSELKTTPESEI